MTDFAMPHKPPQPVIQIQKCFSSVPGVFFS